MVRRTITKSVNPTEPWPATSLRNLRSANIRFQADQELGGRTRVVMGSLPPLTALAGSHGFLADSHLADRTVPSLVITKSGHEH